MHNLISKQVGRILYTVNCGKLKCQATQLIDLLGLGTKDAQTAFTLASATN
jgi:hypothetical protein